LFKLKSMLKRMPARLLWRLRSLNVKTPSDSGWTISCIWQSTSSNNTGS
jgi:hypothetical protein